MTATQTRRLRSAIRATLPDAMWAWSDPVQAAEMGLHALRDELDEALAVLGLPPRFRADVADGDLAAALRVAHANRDEARMRVWDMRKDSNG